MSTDPSLSKEDSSETFGTAPPLIDGMDRKRHWRKTKFPFRGMFCTPSPGYVARHPDIPSVRRKLFNETKSNGRIDTFAMGTEERSMNEDQMVKEYGMVLSSRILGPNGPKLVKRNLDAHEECMREFPHLELKEMEERSRANHEIVSEWLKKAEIANEVGKGKESISRQAIQPQGKRSSFREPAEKMLDSLTAMQRYPIERYIEDLHQNEDQAVQTARIYRNKFEHEECKAKMAEESAARKQLSCLTFWRNNIAEQSCRGGKMVNLALKRSYKKS